MARQEWTQFSIRSEVIPCYINQKQFLPSMYRTFIHSHQLWSEMFWAYIHNKNNTTKWKRRKRTWNMQTGAKIHLQRNSSKYFCCSVDGALFNAYIPFNRVKLIENKFGCQFFYPSFFCRKFYYHVIFCSSLLEQLYWNCCSVARWIECELRECMCDKAIFLAMPFSIYIVQRL